MPTTGTVEIAGWTRHPIRRPIVRPPLIDRVRVPAILPDRRSDGSRERGQRAALCGIAPRSGELAPGGAPTRGSRRVDVPPSAELSGGERQRVATLGRWLPAGVVLANGRPQPDSTTGLEIIGLLEELNQKTARRSPSSPTNASRSPMPRRVELLDGRIVHDTGRRLIGRDARALHEGRRCDPHG